MKNIVLQKIRIPAAFFLLYNALLNAVFADNRYFKIFAVGCAVFSALLLFCCIKEDGGRVYKAVFSAVFSTAFLASAAGVFGVIVCYRIGAALFILISASEIIRLEIRAKNRVFAHIAAVVFAYIPLIASLCFVYCDIKPELYGNGTVTVSDNGGYETVSKRTYTTDRGYSVIYYPETDTDTKLPVIAYLHGFFIYNTSDEYEQTFYYLSSCGYIVIAPNYESMFLDPANYTSTAVNQINDGIKFAEDSLGLKPAKRDGEYLIGLVGHSVGAVTALNICAEDKLPGVRFAVSLNASDGGADIIPKDDLSGIDKSVNVLMAVGKDDTEPCFRTSASRWESLSDHPGENKAFYVLYSDENGEERVIAAHRFMKKNESTSDNLIRYGVHKWCKAIAEWSFYGESYDNWHGEAALYMGYWSDGTPLRPASSGMIEY